jgi:predicted acetyltransferase
MALPRPAFASYIAELVDKRNPQRLQPNRVPSHTYWLYTDQHEIAGFVKIRFELDDLWNASVAGNPPSAVGSKGRKEFFVPTPLRPCVKAPLNSCRNQPKQSK